MPRFYISFQTANAAHQDDEGQDLPGLEEARAAAIEAAREIIAGDIKYPTRNPLLGVVITNSAGQELAKIPAKDVLPESLK